MKVAVITPYYREPEEKLWRCHNSIKTQTMAADHIMIADGQANPAVDSWDVQHLKLPVGTADSGDTPRFIGLLLAFAQGYDAVTLVDGDNWYEARHVEYMASIQRSSGAPIVTCPRTLRRLDASVLGVCVESDGDSFNDFNCYLFTKDAMPAIRPLAFRDRKAAYFTDRYLWSQLRQSGIPIARSPHPSINYETTIIDHYRERGEEPPPESKIGIYFEATGETRTLTEAEVRDLESDPSYRFDDWKPV